MASHDDIALDEEFAQTTMRGRCSGDFAHARPYRRFFLLNLVPSVPGHGIPRCSVRSSSRWASTII